MRSSVHRATPMPNTHRHTACGSFGLQRLSSEMRCIWIRCCANLIQNYVVSVIMPTPACNPLGTQNEIKLISIWRKSVVCTMHTYLHNDDGTLWFRLILFFLSPSFRFSLCDMATTRKYVVIEMGTVSIYFCWHFSRLAVIVRCSPLYEMSRISVKLHFAQCVRKLGAPHHVHSSWPASFSTHPIGTRANRFCAHDAIT